MSSIQAYKDLHHGKDSANYSIALNDKQLVDYLEGRISSDYSTPMTRAQIERKGEAWQRKVYNNMMASKNLGSIMKVHGSQLNITDTDKYCYVLTYSFPCQDLSSAGKGAGMEKGSGTRSGLLWEVERILKEVTERPQVLIMENVPEVAGTKNMPHFAKWLAVLEELGYKTKWGVLNAKEFGVPQNRARCFAVSVLGDYYYDLPIGFPLKYRLKDMLEKNVDGNYYLKEETIQALNIHKERHEAQGHGFGWKPTDGGGYATTIKTESGYRPDSNFVIEKSR